MTLPPMPEHFDYEISYVYDKQGDALPASEAMLDYGRACCEAAIEEAAKIAEDMDFDPSQTIASEIRALKEKP